MGGYQFFNQVGEKVEVSEIVNCAAKADIVFFGELHDIKPVHELELKLTESLFALKKNNLVLGAEMFEADDQIKIDEYFANLISTRSFEKEARLWSNYQISYKPMLEFAKKNKLKFIASNTPRRYAAFVARHGLDKLTDFTETSRQFFAPLPVQADMTLKGYKAMQRMKQMPGMPQLKYIAEAQALKDATMAHFILENYKPGNLFLHYNGTYHSQNHEGIVWFIKQAKPELKIVTIASVLQSDINTLNNQNKNLADFVLVVDAIEK